MIDSEFKANGDSPLNHDFLQSGFLGLSRNLWRLAIVLAITQLSFSLWKWEFGIFLITVIEPWQIGVTFSIIPVADLLGSILAGIITDFIGRRWTLAFGFVPMFVGLITMSYFPIWPLIPLQFGLVWFGKSIVLLTSLAIPADVIESDNRRNPARRIMMVMMPLWFVDGLGPLVGAFMFSFGFSSVDLYFTGAMLALGAIPLTGLIIKESLSAEIIENAKVGPILSFRKLGSNFWKLVIGMLIFRFFWNFAIDYQGNLCVSEWDVDVATFGLSWTIFSFATSALIYLVSGLTDKHLKGGLIASVAGNGLVYLAFSIGSGSYQLFLLSILWAIPCNFWDGSERSIIILSVSEETKGRALGTYQFVMSVPSIIAAYLGSLLWEASGSLRTVYAFAGFAMLFSLFILIPILKSINIKKENNGYVPTER